MAVPDMNTYYLKRATGKEIVLNSYMHIHYLRLHTFKNWPSSAHAYPTRLASSGFYYRGNGTEVICFKCDGTVDDWEWIDSPWDKHKRRFPSCLFIMGQDDTNVPFDAPSNQGANWSEVLASISSSIQGLSINNTNAALQTGASDMPPRIEHNDSAGLDPSTTSTTQSSARHLPMLQANNVVNTASANVSSSDTESVFPESLTPRFNHYVTSVSQSISRGHAYYAGLTNQLTRHNNTDILNSNTLRTLNNIYRTHDFDEFAVSNAQAQFRLESRRLASFRDWPEESFVNAEDLAAAGFMYTRSGDRVQCVFCFGILRNWEEGDVPMDEHRRYFPDCPFVQGLNVSNTALNRSQRQQARGNQNRNTASSLGIRTPANVESTDVAGNTTDIAEMGIITDKPKHPDYAIEVTRQQSYQRWPSQMKQTPAKLASAGFFYSGMADNVKCFYCDGGLRNWEPVDDPWSEHARWFPGCGYVKLMKGEEYIKEVAKNYGGNEKNAATSGRKGFDKREVQARMDTPTVRAVLDMGYTKELVTKAITHKLLETGDDFDNASNLLEAIFNIEEQIKNGSYVEPELPEPAVENTLGSKKYDSNGGHHGGTNTEKTDTPPGQASYKSHKGEKKKRKKQKKKSGNVAVQKMDVDVEKGIPNENIDKSGSEDVEASLVDEIQSLRAENEKQKEMRICKICMDEEANMVFLPCGHLVACFRCVTAIRSCPICRKYIRGTVRTFFS